MAAGSALPQSKRRRQTEEEAAEEDEMKVCVCGWGGVGGGSDGWFLPTSHTRGPRCATSYLCSACWACEEAATLVFHAEIEIESKGISQSHSMLNPHTALPHPQSILAPLPLCPLAPPPPPLFPPDPPRIS
jgi:hypothetical protein